MEIGMMNVILFFQGISEFLFIFMFDLGEIRYKRAAQNAVKQL